MLAILGPDITNGSRPRVSDGRFLFVFPIILILLLGVTFGSGFTPRLGVVSEGSGELGAELVTSLRDVDGIEVERFTDEESITGAIESGEVDAGVTIPEGYDEQLRSGDEATIEYLARAGASAIAIRTTVDSLVVEQGARVRAALFSVDHGVGDFEQTTRIASELAQAKYYWLSLLEPPLSRLLLLKWCVSTFDTSCSATGQKCPVENGRYP